MDMISKRRRPSDGMDYPTWLLHRENELDAQPHWLDVQPPEPRELGPQDSLSGRTAVAQPGDSISRLLGTSDPSAIGAFSRANGLKPGDSTIYAGRTYFLPNDSGGSAQDRGEGLLMIRRDNARKAQLEADRAQGSDLAAQARYLLDQFSYIPQYFHPYIGTETPAGASSQTTTKPSLLGRINDAVDNFQLPPSALDRSPTARAIGGYVGHEVGKEVGHVTGAAKVVKGIGEGALLFGRLLNPIDPYLSDPGDAAWDHVFGGLGSGYDYVHSRIDDPKLAGSDISNAWHQFRLAHDPSASPQGATLADEVRRNAAIGKNDGELEAEIAALFGGGPATKAIRELGALKASTAADFAAIGVPKRAIRRWSKPYDGRGHHNIPVGWAQENGISPLIYDDPLFVVDGAGMNFGDFQIEHFGLDDAFQGGGSKRKRTNWSGKDMGLSRYSGPKRLWRGTPPLMKAAIGTGAAAGVAASEQMRRR